MKRNWVQVVTLVVALGTIESRAVDVSVPAMSFTDVAGVGTDGALCIGWQFTPITNIFVTHLGYYDYNNDGLVGDHDVGIFALGGSLMVSNRVLSTDPVIGGDSPNGYYHYHLLGSRVELSAGTTYRIAAVSSWSDPAVPFDNYVTFAANPLLTWGGSAYASVFSGLSYPDVTPGGLAYGNPNFLFSTVPEPSSLALIATGGLLAFRRYRRG